MKSPYPYFGNKNRVAIAIWERLGKIKNYVEPFFGSGVVLLSRPDYDPNKVPLETVNDKDGFICNFWRAVQNNPEKLAYYADQPFIESDLHARHIWLNYKRNNLTSKLEGDPDFCDYKVAGWWVWGICFWIGREWCVGRGPWKIENNELIKRKGEGIGIYRQLPHLGSNGQNIYGKKTRGKLLQIFQELQNRIKNVRVCSGDWTRVMGKTVTYKHGLTGIFLDPPYSEKANRRENLYSQEDLKVAYDVRKWCIKNGDNSKLRIAFCGYEDEHDSEISNTWERFYWKGKAGYTAQSDKKKKRDEVIWFSPACLRI